MPDNSVSVVFKGYDELSSVMKTIASSGKGLSKEYEELERRGQALSSGNEKLQKKISELNKKVISAKATMQEATRQFKKTGDEADGIKLENATKEYEKYSAALKEAKSASEIVQKSMRNTAEDMRKVFDGEFKPADAASGGFMSKLFGGDISKKLANSGLLQMAGDSVSNALGAAAESMLGQPLATLGSGLASGILSGASSGAIFGPKGVMIGASIGAASGLINGGTQILGEQDEAFKEYYKSLYEDANAATAESLSSGSTLAAGRETTKLSFNTLLGDDKKANAFLEQVQDTANTTPFLYDDLVGISKTMLSFGTAVDDIIPTLTKVGDAGAALGLGTSDIGTIATYLGRMQSSDKATLEYLNPLNERGFSVFQWLADDQGVSVGDVYSQISKGELSGSYVSDVILQQFEKLYAGMMDIQSKSTEGLDSTLQGLKENVDAAGGDAYNEARKEAKEADIAAYNGALGDKLAELNAVGGEVKAHGENLSDQYQREALNAVLLGDFNKAPDVFAPEDLEKLEGLRQQFSEAEEVYRNGSMEAGQKMVDLKEEAEALATAAFESSEWYQKMEELDNEQIAATRELTAKMDAVTNALNKNNELSRGTMSTEAGLKDFLRFVFGEPTTEEEKALSAVGYDVGVLEATGYYNNSHAFGLKYVPFDEYPALLHQGERVLTAAEARTMDRLPPFPAYGSWELSGESFNGEALGADKGRFLDDWAKGSFAFGLNAVPFDGFPALLHQGERIEPPANNRGNGDVHIDLHIDSIVVQGGGEDVVDEIVERLAPTLRTAILRRGG